MQESTSRLLSARPLIVGIASERMISVYPIFGIGFAALFSG
jgi:hypothetical protein